MLLAYKKDDQYLSSNSADITPADWLSLIEEPCIFLVDNQIFCVTAAAVTVANNFAGAKAHLICKSVKKEKMLKAASKNFCSISSLFLWLFKSARFYAVGGRWQCQ